MRGSARIRASKLDEISDCFDEFSDGKGAELAVFGAQCIFEVAIRAYSLDVPNHVTISEVGYEYEGSNSHVIARRVLESSGFVRRETLR